MKLNIYKVIITIISMGRMNIHLDENRDKKLQLLKEKFQIKSKEEVIMRLIDKFELQPDEFNIAKEIDMGDLI